MHKNYISIAFKSEWTLYNQTIAVNLKHAISIFCHFSNEKDTGMDPEPEMVISHHCTLIINVAVTYKCTITTLYNFSTKNHNSLLPQLTHDAGAAP